MFHAEAQNTFLSYPTFDIYPTILDEIFVLLQPHSSSNHQSVDFDSQTASIASVNQHSKSNTKTATTTKLQLHPKSIKKYVPSNQYNETFSEIVQLQKLIPQATVPTRATKGSIGYDVQSITPQSILPGTVQKIPTSLATALPKGMYLRIAPRSSLALKGISVEGGIIDSDYRGKIQVLLRNNTTSPIQLPANSKIAQFIFEKASTPYIHTVTSLPPSSRKGGFGSTDTTK